MEEEGTYMCGNSKVTLQDFALNNMLTSMEAYIDRGPYAFLLNDPNPTDLIRSRFTVFEMQKITESNSQFLSLVLLCIMNAFNAKMKREPEKFKVMIIEEAWKAIMNETMAPFMKSLWKTSRKFNTSAIVVTQQMSDIIGSEFLKDTILENSDTKILLKPTGNQNLLTQTCDLLGLTEHQKAMAMSMNLSNSAVRDVFICLSDKYSGVFTNEVSPQEVIAYESNKGKKKRFLELCQSMSAIEAIQKITEGKR
jgi:type IV secretory pathway VirB4 component